MCLSLSLSWDLELTPNLTSGFGAGPNLNLDFGPSSSFSSCCSSGFSSDSSTVPNAP